MRQFQNWPLPGTATLSPLDRIIILGYLLPLARPIDGGLELDIEKRKEPGSDYSSYVSHGIDATKIEITLLLFRDLYSGKDWFANYDAVKDRLVPRFLAQRNAVPVYHPLLDYEGINSLIFVRRGMLQQQRGQFFTVSLSAYNPKALRIGSGSSSKKVEQGKLNSRATARQSPQNVVTPSANNLGKARRPTS